MNAVGELVLFKFPRQCNIVAGAGAAAATATATMASHALVVADRTLALTTACDVILAHLPVAISQQQVKLKIWA